jgi:hypothetical protein
MKRRVGFPSNVYALFICTSCKTQQRTAQQNLGLPYKNKETTKYALLIAN